jgi:pyruvate kinase
VSGVRKTKIVATAGPRSSDPETLASLLAAGADVVRLNFAHGDATTHAATARRAREVAAEAGRIVGLLADLPGPKMRTGPLIKDQILLYSGERFELTSELIDGDWNRVSTNVERLEDLVSPGDEIFLADGSIVLEVKNVKRGSVESVVARGGVLRSRKGMHLPQAERHLEAFTEKDEEGLHRALDLGLELVGISFVRDAEDVRRARAALPKDGHRPALVAKIETRSAMENLDEIILEADVVMVARGDLGIQIPIHRVPLIQKEIIRRCNATATPVITATQMLESMTREPLPTRAEVTDVANAVLDGTDALMLSEETAIGEHPALAVSTMSDIARAAEGDPGFLPTLHALPEARSVDDPVAWAVARAAVQAAHDLNVTAILCPTRSGATPRRVSAFRPTPPIIGLSDSRETSGALSLAWGVIPYLFPTTETPSDIEEDVERTQQAALETGLVSKGDLVAVVAGAPGPRAGNTDFVRIIRL